MKILQKRVNVVYRFRCRKCRSLYSMDESEKLENDWTYGNVHDRKEYSFPSNPLNRFYCPVCEAIEIMESSDMHKYAVMDNGSEIKVY